MRAEHGPRFPNIQRRLGAVGARPAAGPAPAALRCAIDDAGNRARVSAKSSKAPAFFTAAASETRSPLSRGPRAPRGRRGPSSPPPAPTPPRIRPPATTPRSNDTRRRRSRPPPCPRGRRYTAPAPRGDEFGIAPCGETKLRSPRPRPAAHLMNGRFSIQEARVAQDPEPGALRPDVIWMRS